MDVKPNYAEATDGTKMISEDSWLEPYAPALKNRYARYQWLKSEIEKHEGGLLKFSEGYKRFGFNRVENYNGTGKNGILYREWAAGANRLFLHGEFNGWNRDSHEATKDEFGVFSLFLPDHDNGQPAIPHATKVKIALVLPNGEKVDRIPAWIKVVWQQQNSPLYDGVYWNPPQPYQWKHNSPVPPTDLRIYECHVGMSSQEPKINTYIEFTRDVLPWVVESKYNAIQLMAVMEHAYYASFGYQVTNFFAVSSRFGTPDELKAMIDRAHELGLVVLLDIVHSHASKNVDDGLNRFDGTDHLYFHEGGKGYHPIWDSRLFNYGNWEVLRFLMSNARWFIDEYHFDGFRFDGVTSMIYTHHGVAHAFTRGYDEYFDGNLVDQEAVTYLTLVNDMLHSLRPKESRVITIAEEVSGFVGMCRPIEVGGIGFDYRLNMGIPDKWIELLSKVKDEDWNMGAIAWTLTNRRHLEANIAYCESHDQALVGDKTIAFWLMDKDMYWHMSVLQDMNPVISRGVALHKMIRLITCALGGEGYLNFMGNEFGHPEWIDFPREGNNNSYHHARRRWDLAKDHLLRYQHLWAFDKAMLALENQYKWLPSAQAYVTLKHEGDKIITFERAGLFFVFNFHPEKSFSDYRLGLSKPGKYKIVLDSDSQPFGGHCRINKHDEYFTQSVPWHGWEHSLLVYIPNRTGLVFALDE
mmetsp:Transcript_3224/g.4447  ORF Transcript_3224/g.4447 Transcript_3224/m.4447 type:complete len:695 (-) Transcript_3224:34-2118(-)